MSKTSRLRKRQTLSSAIPLATISRLDSGNDLPDLVDSTATPRGSINSLPLALLSGTLLKPIFQISHFGQKWMVKRGSAPRLTVWFFSLMRSSHTFPKAVPCGRGRWWWRGHPRVLRDVWRELHGCSMGMLLRWRSIRLGASQIEWWWIELPVSRVVDCNLLCFLCSRAAVENETKK